MWRRVREVYSFGACLFLLFSLSVPGHAGPPPPNWMEIEGFRGLRWGVTKEIAQSVYPDLAFVRYALTSETEPPSAMYERQNEDRRIAGIRMDEILYWFRNDSFHRVTAILGSKVGPRTLETPAANAFDRLSDTISRVAGAPVEDRTHRGVWNGNRKGVWRYGGLTIALACFDPPGVNGEELILEITKETASK